MIELDPREVARVPRDVSEQETGRLSCHRQTPRNQGPLARSVTVLGVRDTYTGTISAPVAG